MKLMPSNPTHNPSATEENVDVMLAKEWMFPQTIEEVEAMEKELENEPAPDLSVLEDAEFLWQKIVAIKAASDEGSDDGVSHESTDTQSRLPLMGMLKKRSKLKGKEIAHRMGTTPELLSNFGANTNVLPFRARKELDDRAAATIPDVEAGDILEWTEEPVNQAMAAYSDKPFAPQEITYKSLVLRSGLNEEEQKFWLSLDEEEV